MKHKEREFEQEFGRICPLWGMRYFKIPDFIPIKENKIIAHKRFCDGILVTPNLNYLLEFKMNYNALLPHQLITQSKVLAINSTYYSLRKKVLKKGVFYTVEQNSNVLYKTNDIMKLFEFFHDPKEIYSQEIIKQGINILIPEKLKKRLNRVRY